MVLKRLFPLAISLILLISFGFKGGEELVGLWKGVESGEVGYVNISENGEAYFIIDGDTLVGKFTAEGLDMVMKYQVNRKVKPHTIDFIVYTLPNNIELKRLPGIFRLLNEDQMELCLNFEGNETPAAFEGCEGIILNRVKAE